MNPLMTGLTQEREKREIGGWDDFTMNGFPSGGPSAVNVHTASNTSATLHCDILVMIHSAEGAITWWHNTTPQEIAFLSLSLSFFLSLSLSLLFSIYFLSYRDFSKKSFEEKMTHEQKMDKCSPQPYGLKLQILCLWMASSHSLNASLIRFVTHRGTLYGTPAPGSPDSPVSLSLFLSPSLSLMVSPGILSASKGFPIR